MRCRTQCGNTLFGDALPQDSKGARRGLSPPGAVLYLLYLLNLLTILAVLRAVARP